MENTTCPTWNVYVTLVLNIIIIVISLGKQVLNNKKQINVTDILSNLQTVINPPKKEIEIEVPDDLKSSKQK